MSVDSTALERSALERKDRDELVTIAQALGGKPAARAAKATIVNLILELTGVAGDSAPAPAPAKATRGRKAAAPAEAPDDELDEGDQPSDDDAPEASDDAPADAASEEGSELDQADGGAGPVDDGAPSPRSPGRGDDARPTEAGQPRDQRQQPDQRQRDPRQQPDADQPRDPGQPRDAAQGGPVDADDDEGGNRRRRRRGRNRDRNGEGPAPLADEWVGDPVDVEGIVDLRDEGYGFLRVKGFLPSRDDAYISVKQARQFGLRRGDLVAGASRPALRNEKNPALLRIDRVNGADPETSRSRTRFEDLTVVAPGEPLRIEAEPLAQVGRGQRALVAGPQRSGKTALLKQVVRSIEQHEPEVQLFVLLVDERPEDITELRRWAEAEGTQVVASAFDRPIEEHAQIAELVIERAKRLVEGGADVVVVADGLTRLTRAHHLLASSGQRPVTGGVDVAALVAARRFLGAARNLEEGGSLTLVATALVGTGSPTDEVVYDELKGTVNLEVRLQPE